MSPTDYITAVGSIGTLLGVLIVLYVLRRNHDWYRRQYALDIMREWNDQALSHTTVIEQSFPGLFHVDTKVKNPVEMTKNDAVGIYTADPKNPKNLAIRTHISELLNYLEYVSTAYMHSVADKKIIETSFKQSLVNIEKILINYIEIVKERRGYQPWQSYLDVVSGWRPGEKDKRPPTA